MLFQQERLRFKWRGLLGNLRLLLFDGIDQHDGQLVVFDAFDHAFTVARDQQRLDLADFFGNLPEVVFLPCCVPALSASNSLNSRSNVPLAGWPPSLNLP